MNAAPLHVRLARGWDESNTSWSAEMNRPMMDRVFPTIASRMADGGSLLDLGCGDGHMSAVFAGAGLRTFAADIELESLKTASRHHAVRTLACASAERIPFADRSFDVVYAGSVFQYTSRETVLAECARVLRPGGVLVTIENLRGHPVARAARVWMRLSGRRYAKHMTPRDHLARRGVGVYREHFASHDAFVFNLTTPFLFVVARAAPRAVYERLHRLDRWLLRRFPALEHFAWHIVLCARR